MEVSTKTPYNALKDEEIQALVSRLKRDVRDRNSQLGVLQSEVQTIGEQIQGRDKERRVFSSNIIHVEEAAELVEEHEQLKRSLQSKKTELKSLEDGSSQEQRELERERERLGGIQKGQLHVAQNKLSVEELKNEYEEKLQLCEATRPRLEKVKQELGTHKDEPPNPSRKPLKVRLDHLIMKTCRQAGLQL